MSGTEYLLAAAILALIFQTWRHGNTVEALSMIAAQERRETADAHEAQVAELCNRIQLPERTAHVSISDHAPPQEPYVHPDLQEEMSILGTD